MSSWIVVTEGRQINWTDGKLEEENTIEVSFGFTFFKLYFFFSCFSD